MLFNNDNELSISPPTTTIVKFYDSANFLIKKSIIE